MSTTHLVQTTFEIIMGLLFIIGFIFEPSIAEWEQKVFKKLKGRKKNGRV